MKNIILVISIFAHSILLANCSPNVEDRLDEDSVILKKDPKQISITFEDYLLVKNAFVRQMFLMNEYLFLINMHESSKFVGTQYRIYDKALVRQFINHGTKKFESIAPLSSGLLNDSTLWFQDVSLSKIVTSKLPKTFNSRDTVLYNSNKLKNLYFNTQLLNDSTALGIGGYHSEYKLQKINLKSGEEVDLFGKYVEKPSDFPYNSWKHAHEGFIFLKPTKDKAVIAYKLFSEFEILDLKTEKSKRYLGPNEIDFRIKPITVQGRNFSITDKNTRRVYINGFCTNDYIYLLYTDNYEMQNNSDLGNKIYVFKWDGTPVSLLKLDNDISGFAVTSDNKTIYAFNPETQFVVRSNLKF